jgi:hypothetical protein
MTIEGTLVQENGNNELNINTAQCVMESEGL